MQRLHAVWGQISPHECMICVGVGVDVGVGVWGWRFGVVGVGMEVWGWRWWGGGGAGGAVHWHLYVSLLTERYLWSFRPLTSHISPYAFVLTAHRAHVH